MRPAQLQKTEFYKFQRKYYFFLQSREQRVAQFLNLLQMSQNSAPPNSYQAHEIIVATIGTIYVSLFVKISNHYIFKPKIQHFFIEFIISNKTLFQLLVDFLTNLTQLTFVACSIFLLGSDDSLGVMIYSDMSWCGLLLALVSFSGILTKEEPNSRLLRAKNVTFLVLTYFLVALHYALGFFYISLPLGLVILYLLNLVINSIEQKFIEAMELLFGYKPDKEIQQEYEYRGYRNSPEYLSKHFPVTPEEVKIKMKNYQKQLKSIKLNTRKKMTENLLKISLAVHLSSQKMMQKGKRDIKNYYGNFNGTVLNKSRKLIENRLYSKTTDQQLHKDSEIREYDSQQYDNSALFYVFPVKLFESSKILSIMFSLLINLGLGIMISYAVDMASTLPKGQYLHILYGFLLLPLRPSISKEQFLNSMALSSLWKYCLYGFFLCVVCLSSSSMTQFSFDSTSNQLVFVPLVQSAVIVLSARLIRQPFTSYSLLMVWVAGVATCCFLIFKFC